MRKTRTDLVVVGLTESTDLAAIEAFRTETGGTYPMLYGVSQATKDAYGVAKAPSLRVVDRQSRRAGDDEAALTKALAAGA